MKNHEKSWKIIKIIKIIIISSNIIKHHQKSWKWLRTSGKIPPGHQNQQSLGLALEKATSESQSDDDLGDWRKTMVKPIGKPWKNHRKMEVYPLVMTNIAIDKGPLKSWVFPLNMLSFNSYGTNCQRVFGVSLCKCGMDVIIVGWILWYFTWHPNNMENRIIVTYIHRG